MAADLRKGSGHQPRAYGRTFGTFSPVRAPWPLCMLCPTPEHLSTATHACRRTTGAARGQMTLEDLPRLRHVEGSTKTRRQQETAGKRQETHLCSFQ